MLFAEKEAKGNLCRTYPVGQHQAGFVQHPERAIQCHDDRAVLVGRVHTEVQNHLLRAVKGLERPDCEFRRVRRELALA